MQTKHTEPEAAPGAEHVLRALLAECLHAPYGLFFLTGEGTRMPNGMEEVSGYAIDAHAHVFAFWVKWDQQRGAPFLARWRESPIEGSWRRSPQYQHAREEAGLQRDASA